MHLNEQRFYLKIINTCLYFIDKCTDLVTRPDHSSNSATNSKKLTVTNCFTSRKQDRLAQTVGGKFLSSH
jgi:hypothetical protein